MDLSQILTSAKRLSELLDHARYDVIWGVLFDTQLATRLANGIALQPLLLYD
jgi:hypothetical protein